MGRLDVDALATHAAAEMERWSVPALEVSVVADGDVLYAGGFGTRDVERGLPVTSKTLFHHGSTAKAFTGALVASLVGDGLLEWDRPVREYVPDLRLSDPVVTERVTMSDLLSHRSGLAQHEWAWLAHPSESRAELLRRLPHLAFASDLRAAFHYCNLAFMLAGEVVAKVTGSTWEEQVRSRLLDPLGMTRTLTAMDDALHDHDHASPYDERDGTIAQIPWRPSDAVGPAGGIFSCADDTARWLLFQLGDGSVDGRRVLGEEGLRATQRTQFPFSHPSPFPEVTHSGYGFGWVQGTYRGRRMVWHNGGFDGFKTEFLLLPDEGIGIATCGATSHTSLLPQAVAHHVADLLLEEEPKAWSADMHELWSKARVAASETRAGTHVVPDAPPSHPLADYVASYDDPGYGTLEVVAKDEELQVRLGELDLVTRHRHFDTWTALYEALHTEFPITFVTDAEGVISEAVVPLEDAVPAVRFTRRIT